MLALAGFMAVIVLVVPYTAYRHRTARFDLTLPSIDFADHARRQLPIISCQAAFAVTSIVLLVTLARDRATAVGDAYNAVIGMFLVAFVSFIGAAIMLSLLPTIEERGPVVTRLLFSLAAHQHFRTLFLAWFALRPLVVVFDLTGVANLLAGILALTMLAGWLVVAALDYRTGIYRRWDSLLFGGFVRILAPHAAEAVSPLLLAFVMFLLNALTILASAIVPVVADDPRGPNLLDRWGRAYAIADFQVTVILLTFIWLAVVGVL